MSWWDIWISKKIPRERMTLLEEQVQADCAIRKIAAVCLYLYGF